MTTPARPYLGVVICGILARHRAGLRTADLLREVGRLEPQWTTPGVYLALRRLRNESLIRSETITGIAGKPQVHFITPEGRTLVKLYRKAVAA